MNPCNLYFLHGMDSGPNGQKAETLRSRYPNLLAPTLPNDPWERLAQLQEPLLPNSVIVGSSLGGLTALMLAAVCPQKIKALVLIAPAVGLKDTARVTAKHQALFESLRIPVGVPTTVVAASDDEVIPLEAIEALVARAPDLRLVSYFKVEDSHTLNRPESHEVMMAAVAFHLGSDPLK